MGMCAIILHTLLKMSQCVLQGATPLHYAIEHHGNDEHMAEALLAHGADANARDDLVNSCCNQHSLCKHHANSMTSS